MTEFLNDRLNNLETIMNKNSISMDLGSSKMSYKSTSTLDAGIRNKKNTEKMSPEDITLEQDMRRNSSGTDIAGNLQLQAKDIDLGKKHSSLRKSPRLDHSGLNQQYKELTELNNTFLKMNRKKILLSDAIEGSEHEVSEVDISRSGDIRKSIKGGRMINQVRV